MPDPLAGLADEGASTTPAAPSFDIEKIKSELAAELQQQFDERVKGFQRLVAARDEELGALRSQIKESRLAGLSEEEREELLDREKDEEIERLRAQLELKDLAPQYGDEMPYFERLLAAESAEDQLKALREFREAALAKAQPAPDPVPEPTVEVPDVDLNRPMRPFSAGVALADGTVMDDAMADRILSATPVPLARLRAGR